MRFSRLALVLALALGAVGTTRAQDIQKNDPSWMYIQVAGNGLSVTIKKSGAEMVSLNFLPGTLLALSDGKPIAGRRDFQGTFQLRAIPVADAKAGAGATIMNAAPFLMQVDSAEVHVENRR